MANNINISDLSFEGIKNSLINYMKGQDTFKDYNFEGSGIRTLIDLLAYNTFYYGYYSNMVANEMFLDTAKLENSVISLTKPLGYLVSSYNSAKATIKMTGLNPNVSEISKFSVFKGLDISGRPYFFYNINPVSILESESSPGFYETDYFDVFEGKGAIKQQLVNVDLDSQSFSLLGTDIDPRTIVIEVGDVAGNNLVRWNSYLLSPETSVGPNSEIFFLERTKRGYMVNFGKYSSNDITSLSTGKQITSQDKVYVSYLVSSGTNGNGISNINFVSDSNNRSITTGSTELEVAIVSRGGISNPDLDEIRFFAPKSFARQNRLVTKNDYYAMLNELGYGSGGRPEFAYKVFGGEEATPPSFGRVFVSIIDLNPTDVSDFSKRNEINEVLSILKTKSVVSILPEYLPPTEMNILLDISVSHPESSNSGMTPKIKTAIKNALFAEYGTKKYDRNVMVQDIIDVVKTSFSGLVVSPNSVSLKIVGISPPALSSNQRKVNFKNPIESVRIIGFDAADVNAQNIGKYLYYHDSRDIQLSTVPIGEVDLLNGIVTIYSNITSNQLTMTIKTPEQNFLSKDELVTYIKNIDQDTSISLL
jgi:hypothetical protein